MIEILEKISNNGKYIFLAYDHGLEHGPTDFNEKSIDPNYILEIAEKGGFSGVILQKGVAEKYYKNSRFRKKVPLILKINGKTRLPKMDPYSPQECSVEFAKSLGAFAVGYTIYPGSEYEWRMIKEFGEIVEEAHKLKMPVIAWIYPRGKSIENESDSDIIAWAARIGLELGADMVKLKYSGSKETFRKVVLAAGKVKVVVSGGEEKSEEEFIEMVRDVMLAGGAGIAVGRNIWQRENPLEITNKIKKIIFK